MIKYHNDQRSSSPSRFPPFERARTQNKYSPSSFSQQIHKETSLPQITASDHQTSWKSECEYDSLQIHTNSPSLMDKNLRSNNLQPSHTEEEPYSLLSSATSGMITAIKLRYKFPNRIYC